MEPAGDEVTGRLREMLATYVPADDTEHAHLARMQALLDTASPLSRHQFEPGHFTASAFVLSEAGQLLLIHHAKLDRWLQPGGHIDAGDASPEAAARRELSEEAAVTDIAGDGRLFDVDVHPIPANPKKNEPPHEHFDLRFLFRAAHTNATAGSDALAVRWVALSDIKHETSDESVQRAARKLGV